MKKTGIFLIPLVLIMLVSCANEEVDLLTEINEELKEEIRKRDEAVNDFVLGLEVIQTDIRDIAKREQLLDGITISDVELARSPQDEIIGDIALVDGLIKKNQNRIQTLELKVKGSEGKLYEFERIVANLKMDLLERESDLDHFKSELVAMEAEYGSLLDDYHEQLMIGRMQDEALHLAYFAYGSKEELEQMHIAEKEGGVLGLGATWKLKDDFNKDYFTAVDMREVHRIPLESERVKLISNHPEDAYELIVDDKQVSELVITDPGRFWSGSKYLAMVVD